MMNHKIDAAEIPTPAGTYTVTWYWDENAESPYDEGFTMLFPARYADYSTGDTISPVARVALNALRTHRRPDDSWSWEFRSGAAIVRYLRMAGKKGVRLVDTSFSPDAPVTDRFEKVHGVAWAPDDATDPDEYTRMVLQQWKAWQNGDVFGWVLTDPSGNEVDSCWGFYDIPGEMDYTLVQATEAAQSDAAERVKQANLVGAGIVGLI